MATTKDANKEVVISVHDLRISFSTDKGRVHAVRGVNFDLYKGEILCIVGESGSGKSVSAKTIMGILPGNGRIDSGSVMFEGEDLTQVSEEEFHRIRGKKIGMIFQDPLSSLNPIMKVGKQITEAVIINSDKLKRYYEELIAKDNIKYRNDMAKRFHRSEAIKAQIKDRREDVAESIKNLKADQSLTPDVRKEKIAELKLSLRDEIAQSKKALATIKAELNPIIKEDKIALRKAKHAAKQQVKEFKAQLIKERDEKILAVKAKYELAIKEEKASAASDKPKRADVRAYKIALKLKKKIKKGDDVKVSREEVDAKLADLSTKVGISATEHKLHREIEEIEENYINSVKITRAEAKRMAVKVMTEVGIPNAPRRYKQYPFEFSGGMRQRIVIAIALTQNPDILILDEPTTALDVTIQAQILELVNNLKRNRNLSAIFITHDLGVVANMADRVAVMYAGKIVEYGLVNEIFYDPRHPYTWALLSSIPDIDSKERLEAIPGTPPNMVYPPKGDAFALRSHYAMAVDFKKEPPMFKITDTHFAATWLLDSRAPKAEMPKIVSERIRISLERAKKEEAKK